MTQQIAASLDKQIKKCWTMPRGTEAGQLFVSVYISLTLDGRVAAPPTATDGDRYRLDDAYRAAASAAIRAVHMCAPFSLPPEHYDIWRDLVISFSPKDIQPSDVY